jgi:glycosyltransferase involved in cell wall biosynthesis
MIKPKIIVVMPAYNAQKTLQKTYQRIPKDIVDEILVVDDGSHDKTVAVAKQLGLKVIVHPKNLGYGGNQKTCYKHALKLAADIVVMIHPDYQYDPQYTKYLIQPIIDGSFDIMLGSRLRTREETLKNGMPVYKYIFNRFLTLMENIVLGLNLSEYHTGFRAFNKKSLSKINFQNFSNDFIFDQQILIDAHLKGFRIGEIFVPCKYTKESSSINFIRSVKYGLEIMINLIWAILKINLYQ